jgi:RNA polymerase primary sigma factor
MKLEQSSEGQPSLPRTFKMAVWAGVENSVKIHIDRGDHLEARDDQGCTPLMLAASRKNQKICKLLIDAGACLFSVDKLGRTALDIALQLEATDVVRMLQEAASSSQKILSKSSNLIDELLVSIEHDHLLTDSSMYREIEFIDLEDVSNETSDWLPEEELKLSQKDTALYLSIQSTEKAISAFEPIDKSVGWSDLDVYLPAKASPLTREQDPEVSAELRLLLLRVMREGSVPFMSIDAISAKLADSDAFEFPSQVFRVIDELGGQVDERFEYDSDYETYKVYVDHMETEVETEQVSEALSYLEGVSSNQYEPLRMYFRDGNGCSLITADDEVFLGRKMQSGHEEIMSVVSRIPDLTLKKPLEMR